MSEHRAGSGAAAANASAAPAIDPRALRHVLDRLARADSPPWLHQEVARRMAARLPVIRQPPAQWLDWWAFTGAGAEAVQAVWPQAQRLMVEPTPLLQARSGAVPAAPWWSLRGRRASKPQVWLSSEVPPQAAQMLWANLVLHTAPDPEASLAVWHRALAADGFLMFSAFGPDTLRELREVYAEAGWPAPHPPFVDMHDLGDMLVHGGFADPVMDQETITLTWSSAAALLAELRGLGGHLGLQRHPGLRTPRWLGRLQQALTARADAQGRIAMRFEVVYGHAYKGKPRPAPGAPVVVSLDALHSRRTSHKP
jgi:malonyl-CoA O-methyltransferase